MANGLTIPTQLTQNSSYITYPRVIGAMALITAASVAPAVIRGMILLPTSSVYAASFASLVTVYFCSKKVWDKFPTEWHATCFKVMQAISSQMVALGVSLHVLSLLGKPVTINREGVGFIICWSALEIFAIMMYKV